MYETRQSSIAAWQCCRAWHWLGGPQWQLAAMAIPAIRLAAPGESSLLPQLQGRGALAQGWVALQGLVMPPRVAPRQVVVIPIPASTLTDAQRRELAAMAQEIVDRLRGAGLRVHLDDRINQKPGWKYNEWELKVVAAQLSLLPVHHWSTCVEAQADLPAPALKGASADAILWTVFAG